LSYKFKDESKDELKVIEFEQVKKVITFDELIQSMNEKVDNTGNISKNLL